MPSIISIGGEVLLFKTRVSRKPIFAGPFYRGDTIIYKHLMLPYNVISLIFEVFNFIITDFSFFYIDNVMQFDFNVSHVFNFLVPPWNTINIYESIVHH